MGVLAYGGNVYINNDADIHIKSQANGGNSKEVAGLYTSYDGHINGSADSTINIHAEVLVRLPVSPTVLMMFLLK